MDEKTLTEDMVRNVMLTWYASTNDHRPVDEFVDMLADDVEMWYPERDTPFVGKEAFRAWYANVLDVYFDETHEIESCAIRLDGNRAEVRVIVRWEARSWQRGTARSAYRAFHAHQRWELERQEPDGRVVIKKKIGEAFEPTAPVYGVGR